MLELAREKGLRIGCAPDTFLGAGLQTCRQLIDAGAIGEPIGATAFMTCRGHENWHPNPDFYYQLGGGPMFDMGPYYLTALVALIGPCGASQVLRASVFPSERSRARQGSVARSLSKFRRTLRRWQILQAELSGR